MFIKTVASLTLKMTVLAGTPGNSESQLTSLLTLREMNLKPEEVVLTAGGAAWLHAGWRKHRIPARANLNYCVR
ncbi:MAG: hypothetical protein A3E83_04940 [Gammaproteobacteria bacterium RIFCSPHIGHO2_12_FULL_41_20]|nr:MAG: hypothetical protein A3E83_04940 [Gammaproteobacteria bacterium RIFCSPHIGHO2_12_FULL_41_20]